MILYHYRISPFSEKIRLMLSYTGIAWQSVIVPPMPPRKHLDDLLGGYRRIPVMQQGRDIFCDTRLICDEIAHTYGADHLSYSRCEAQIRHFVERTNTQVFLAVAESAQPRAILPKLLTQYWPWQVVAMIRDRAKIAKQSKVGRSRSAQRRQILDDWRTELEERLSQTDYLYDDRPTLADFAAYHVAWFAQQTQTGHFLSPASAAGKWQSKMKAYESETPAASQWHQISDSIAELKPRVINDQQRVDSLINAEVNIGPNDYALDRVQGVLVGADDQRWIIAREHEDLGTVHVHFPKTGFELKQGWLSPDSD